MAQRSQIIDITKSYLPGDPNAFVQNLVNTDREDGEEKTIPVLLYEGYNFLPTSYGYRSYFGVVPKLDILDLTSRVQFVFSYQLPNYQFRLIALAEDGIWTTDPGTLDSPWTHEVTVAYSSTVLEEWTACIIENTLYMYHQADAVVYKTNIDSGGELEILNFAPSFLNMAGQMGIFKAGTRLGFWDSANSIAWSSNLDLADVTPSIENYAGNEIFEAIVGRIVLVKGHGEGFIVYCTKAIVGATFDQQGILLWDAKKILSGVGISYTRAVTHGQDDVEHIAYTSNGIYMIGKFNAIAGKHDLQVIIPEVYDFLRETRDPVWLDTINNRYVFFNILNPNYIYGLTSFSYVPGAQLNERFYIGGNPWDGESLPEVDMDGNAAAQAIRQMVTFGFDSFPDTSALWTIHSMETQDGTIGPLSSGGGTRPAETPGFTTADIVSSYITGLTLPSELTPTLAEHPDSVSQYLGRLPQGSVTVTNAMGESLIKKMQEQMNDWKMFNMHQIEAVTRIQAATKTVNTPGVIGYTSPPSVPATTVTNDVIGTYKTGHGNFEIQKDEPLRRLLLRKSWQERYTITRKKTTSYALRSVVDTGIAGYSFVGTYTMTADTLVPAGSAIPPTFDVTLNIFNASLATAQAQKRADCYAQSPADVIKNPGTVTVYREAAPTGTGNSARVTYYETLPSTTPSASYVNNTAAVYSDGNTYYLDQTDVYEYIVDTDTYDMGTTTWQATQVAYGRTTVQVTSSPPTVVVDSSIPIFPTGPSAATFFPKAWDGVETLKIIAASALSPWHYLEGTFGIELLGDPITGAAAAADAGGYTAYGSSTLPGSFDVTYSISSYLMQTGAASLLYPTFEGSYVLDLHLKKWGKMKNRFTALIDLNPVNQTTPNLLIAQDKGMNAALKMADDDTIRVFDEFPIDSLARWGKIGHYRLGMCNALETKAAFRGPCTGILSVDASLDGRTIDTSRHYQMAYTNSGLVEAYPDISCRWFVVSLTGNYDLTGLEFRDKVVSRR